ncbi:ATP-binding cassette domain-containing protein [Kocuria rhizophila]|nr:ATP-binding cassette domain-containing protein [Kocuria rhizophila]
MQEAEKQETRHRGATRVDQQELRTCAVPLLRGPQGEQASPAPEAQTLASFRDVSKVFVTGSKRRTRTVTAVDSVDLDIRRGKIFAVIRLLGAGKSTLVRLINGRQPITSGSLAAGRQVDGRSETQAGPDRRDIGRTSSSSTCSRPAPWPYIRVPAQARRWKPEDRRARWQSCSRLGTHRARQSPRAALGRPEAAGGHRASARDEPRLPLANESTSALDPETTQEVLEPAATR